MPTALFPLVLFALWTIVLVLAVLIWRAVLMAKREFRPSTFPNGMAHGPDTYWRLNRAHANAIENLPAFGVVVIAGVLVSVPGSWFETLAWVVLGGRIVQSCFHVAGGTDLIVNLRFGAYFIQLAATIAMAVQVLLHLGMK